jgi:leucine dehydrogenase
MSEIKILSASDLTENPVIGQMANMGHEQILFCNDEATGLKAIIAVHNTILGPALGGTRIWAYQNEMEALNDVLRLSRGMTYKNAISGFFLVDPTRLNSSVRFVITTFMRNTILVSQSSSI